MPQAACPCCLLAGILPLLAVRQLDGESCTIARLACHRDLPAVGLDDRLHDGQAQAVAPVCAVVPPVEAFKDVGQIVGQNAGACVADPEPHSRCALCSAEFDLAASWPISSLALIEDRKSVVQGKSVDLDGRRIIKNSELGR